MGRCQRLRSRPDRTLPAHSRWQRDAGIHPVSLRESLRHAEADTANRRAMSLPGDAVSHETPDSLTAAAHSALKDLEQLFEGGKKFGVRRRKSPVLSGTEIVDHLLLKGHGQTRREAHTLAQTLYANAYLVLAETGESPGIFEDLPRTNYRLARGALKNTEAILRDEIERTRKEAREDEPLFRQYSQAL